MSYLSHAGVDVIVWWLNDGQAYTPQQVATWLNQLNTGTVERVLGKAN